MKQDGGRADMTASRQPSASMPDNVSPGPPRRERKSFRQIERKLVAPARILKAGLDPFDLGCGDAKVVLQETADPHCRRHLILRHPDAFTAQLLWPLDAAIVADIDRRVTEGARQESGYGDVRRL